MRGFSIYVSNPIGDATREYIVRMANAGFTGVFTSLHIPEDNPKLLQSRLAQLAGWCAQSDLELVADVSDTGLRRMGWTLRDPARILDTGVTGLRIDDGIDLAEVATLSHAMPVALNASTMSQHDIDILRRNDANFDHLEAWHNYYPRPETGLDREWYRAKNEWFHSLGLKTMGFVSGDGELRGPLFQHLPTLEIHREWNPLAAALDLERLQTDRIYIADNTITDSSLNAFTHYAETGTIGLRLDSVPSALTARVWHNRPDVARDVIRLLESRRLQVLPTKPNDGEAEARPTGTLTLDTTDYGRYAGELQITRRDLPPDPRVQVLGRVIDADRSLLPCIGAGTGITLNQGE
ncbi:MupG family TIM beta-alpha barrel fold protein [Bifidobacterium aquikefiricola]|uniref:MupG family TIM beta-alpha barrel fold protein n=1 Tax=Bifidobacterium aquikefiricola TaxID=3059038 RepID=A0AB39U4V9_9BIFI